MLLRRGLAHGRDERGRPRKFKREVEPPSRPATATPKKKSRVKSIQEGETLKGYRVKLYPNQDQLRYLGAAQQELLAMWNVIVITWQTHADYCVRYAEDHGLIGPVPPRPTSERTTNVPAEILEWEEYARLCGQRRRDALEHCKSVPGLSRRDWANRAADYHEIKLTAKAREQTQLDYRVLRAAVPGITTAHMAQAVVETYKSSIRKGRRAPKLKKRALDMPLLLRSGKALLKLGDYGIRATASGKTRLTGQRRCWVKFGPLTIKGRFHREPPGPFLEGVSIRLASDGWYASAKVRTKPQKLPKPTRKVIAINPGLECLYADSEEAVIDNPRGNAYSIRVRELSDWIDEAETHWDQVYRRNQLGRYQERFARRVEDLIYSKILPRLADFETIVISKTGKRVAQGAQTRLSVNDEGGYVSAMGLLQQLAIQRYGEYDPKENPMGRVRVREAFGLSQKCSACGSEHPTRYQRSNQRRRDQQTDCVNPHCKRRHIHVDVNHAISLRAEFERERVAA